MRKKEKLIEYFNRNEAKEDELLISGDDNLMNESYPVTPPRLS